MEKEFIPYEQAIALKKLGFEEPCFGFYFPNTTLIQIHTTGFPNDKKDCILAPTFSQVFRFFREKHGYFQLFDYQHGDSKINRGFFFNIININNEDFFFPEDFENEIYKTYEEAELECLKKLIEIVKK